MDEIINFQNIIEYLHHVLSLRLGDYGYGSPRLLFIYSNLFVVNLYITLLTVLPEFFYWKRKNKKSKRNTGKEVEHHAFALLQQENN